MPKRRRSRSVKSAASPIRLFISHSSEDKRLAAGVLNLLRAALALRPATIRCTSADGTRLPGGVRVDEQLQRDVRDAEVFICIVSACSILSSYVLVEMGARWGAGKHVMPLLAPGERVSILPGPLRGLNALRLDSAGQVDQFVAEVGKSLGVKASAGPEYQQQRSQIARIRPRRRRDPTERLAGELAELRAGNAALLDQIRKIEESSWRPHPTLKSLIVESRVDATGSGEQVRRWVDLRAPEPIVNLEIPYTFVVGKPKGKAIFRDDLVTEIQRPKSALEVRFKRKQVRDPRVVAGKIEILGALTPKTGFVGFVIRQPFERAFYMTRKELAHAYATDKWKTEYMSVDVLTPTKVLEMSVTFPATFDGVSPKPVAFVGHDETRHDQETERMQSTFTFKRQTAFVRVSRPIRGLQYAIYWTPPT